MSRCRKLAVVALAVAVAGGVAPAAPSQSPLQPIPFAEVSLEEGLWASRQETNRHQTVGHLLDLCELEGRVRNMWRAAGRLDGEAEGTRRRDADLYRCIEAASHALAAEPDPELHGRLARIIAAIQAAQDEDGYVHSIYGIKRPAKLEQRHLDLFSVGHLIDAGLAYRAATGEPSLFDVARRYVALADRMYGAASPEPTAFDHPKLEESLVRLYRHTGEARYLDFAESLVEHRHADPRWSNRPVRELSEATGHVIASLFLYEGMLAVGVETADPSLIDATRRVWEDAVSRRMYLTGAMGHKSESFTEPYALDNLTSIGEGCQSHALARLSHSLFLADPDSRYADVIERVVYNNLLANVGLDGRRFYYHNKLSARPALALGEPFAHPQPRLESPRWPRECLARQPWFLCPCCPPNISMAVGTLGQFAYAAGSDRIYVNLYLACDAKVPVSGTAVRMTQRTHYPWDGRVRLAVQPDAPTAFTLCLRIPDWCRGLESTDGLYRIARAEQVDTPLHPDFDMGPVAFRNRQDMHEISVLVNGQETGIGSLQKGYVEINRCWVQGDVVELNLPMPILQIESDPRVEANLGRVALQRGPIVYCVEAVDHGGAIDGLTLPERSALALEYRPDLLGGIVVIAGNAQTRDGSPIPLVAVPYGAWANREVGEMDVWIRTAPAE